MAHTLTVGEAEAQVREFAVEFDTPNVRRAVLLAECGRLSWFDIYAVAREALAKARAEVSV
jgi:hypothetical protein